MKDTAPTFPTKNFLPHPQKNTIQTDNMKMPTWQGMLCTDRGSSSIVQRYDDPLTLPMIYRDITPKVSSSNIFFIESSCNPRPLYREWCSMESWAGQNPESEVWYVLTSPFIYDTTRLMAHLLDYYPNIRVVEANIIQDFRDTPLWNLFTSYDWLRESTWPANSLNNFLRVALVWRWGGFYSDSDVICIKSVKEFANVVAMANKRYANTGVFHGQPHHEVYWKLMEDIAANFNGTLWGNNGPHAITRVMWKLCQVDDLEKIAISQTSCANISILPKEHFYPISSIDPSTYFKDGKGLQMAKLFSASYALHFWNHISKQFPIKVGRNSILDLAAKKYCPITYGVASSHGLFF